MLLASTTTSTTTRIHRSATGVGIPTWDGGIPKAPTRGTWCTRVPQSFTGSRDFLLRITTVVLPDVKPDTRGCDTYLCQLTASHEASCCCTPLPRARSLRNSRNSYRTRVGIPTATRVP
eukprot:2211877-Rhodomonas_salina.1